MNRPVITIFALVLAIAAGEALAQRGGGRGGGNNGNNNDPNNNNGNNNNGNSNGNNNGQPGGGGFGRGPGGMGRGRGGPGWEDWIRRWRERREEEQNRNNPERLKQEAEKKAKKLVADGWVALQVGDVAAATDAFYDALDLNPTLGEAKLGVSLCRAARGDFARAVVEMEAAMRLKADPRLVQFNQGVAYTRQNNRGRALVLFNRYLLENQKAIDEIVLNAQLSILSWMDEKQRKSIAVMPDLLKTVSQSNLLLASNKYTGKDRWGIYWLAAAEVTKLRGQGEKEEFPPELPFLLPGDIAMPEKGAKTAANTLIPENVEIAAATPTPEAVAVNTGPVTGTPKPNLGGPFKLGGGNDTSTATPTPTPTTPSTPSPTPGPAIAVAPEPGPRRGTGVVRTVRGAAFAVATDKLITCERLVAGAREIQVQTVDGKAFDATVIASDAELGLALLKISGASFSPMALADSIHIGPSNIAAFVKPAVFSPDLDVVRGEIYNNLGKMMVRCTTHPRSAGSPIFDSHGKVLAVLSAARDDEPAKLPIIPVEALRKFVEGKLTAATTTAGDVDQSVVEMVVTRQE